MSNTRFYNHENQLLIASVLIGDVIVANLLFLLTSALFHTCMSAGQMRQVMVLSTMIYFACTISHGVVLYKRKVSNHLIVMRVLQNVVTFAIADTVVTYLGGFVHMPMMQTVAQWGLMLVCISLFRIAMRRLVVAWRRSPRRIHNVVIVGSSDNALQLYTEMSETAALGYRVEGYFDYEPSARFEDRCAYLGQPGEVTAYLQNHRDIHELYCCLPSKNSTDILPIIHYCVNHLIHFYSMPNVSNYLHHRMYLTMFGTVPCLTLFNEPLTRVENRAVKRLFDITVSALFLCTLFPIVLLVVAAITKATMPGPIFFRQKRTGLDGRDFYCLKFRSMKVNKDADTLQATKNDPRKTKWGDIMRRTNIDELPQFINVLLGQMSIVGPRPHMVKQTEDYSKLIDNYMVRHYIKPGITGWSQVTGYRGETRQLSQMEGRVRGDIWYMEHWSIWLDIYIMYKTVANAIQGDKQAF